MLLDNEKTETAFKPSSRVAFIFGSRHLTFPLSLSGGDTTWRWRGNKSQIEREILGETHVCEYSVLSLLLKAKGEGRWQIGWPRVFGARSARGGVTPVPGRPCFPFSMCSLRSLPRPLIGTAGSGYRITVASLTPL